MTREGCNQCLGFLKLVWVTNSACSTRLLPPFVALFREESLRLPISQKEASGIFESDAFSASSTIFTDC